MLKSYFISLYRNILRNKFYSLLNILGLSIGLATALFILLYITDEAGYDKHFENYNRIYRVESEITVNNNPQQFATAPPPLGPAMKKEIPEIEEVVRLDELGLFIFRYEEHEFFESRFFYADSSIFRVFNHEFVYGNPGTCLTEPSSIVLTRFTAEKYFGSSNPTGKILTDSEGDSYQVTAVIENLPSNTHLKYDALISVSTLPDKYSTTLPARFWRLGAYTFLLLHENAKITSIHDRFPAFYEKYMEALGKQYNVQFKMMTTPLAETHFRKGLSADQPAGNRAYIYIFSAVALFILLLAAINYMNMATARSANRSREVGMRKVFGADKPSLIYQFLSESVILSLVSLFIAILLVGILLPYFNDFSGKELTLNLFETGRIFLLMLIVALFIGLVSGSYPAFYLSSFQPMVVLKGKLSKSGKQNLLFRRILVVFQFFIAIFMIISTFVIMNQMASLRNKDLGFEKTT
jgi:putative ABC transport system permease protein